MKKSAIFIFISVLVLMIGIVFAALVVPTDIEQPGTQPGEVGNLESPDKCDNCHGGYDLAVEPAFNWRGSMMANAGRDPIFWATLAIAEQDFIYGLPPDSGGAGDLCIRCHSTAGWLSGRSTPTDGSGLAAGDADGVECDFCHKMTNPDNSELLGVMNPPYIANDEQISSTGYYGSGMASIWPGAEKLGPYNDANARHQFLASMFHRSQDFCGTCHDVSNPAVGDLAHNQGAQPVADTVIFDGTPGSVVNGKAAFNNFPYMYGIVERTYSEYWAGTLSGMLVSDYGTLPAELQAGALKAAYDSAMAAQNNPNAPDYVDGAQRTFTCQTCHLRPVTGFGCNKKGAPLRLDLPLHDMTGGNYWMPDAIQYLDAQGKLLLGGGLTQVQLDALAAGKTRALKQLSEAASLSVSGDVLRIVNLTAHKLISGYPEGRRIWLNIKWYDGTNTLLREDGAYGAFATITNPVDGSPYPVSSIIDLNDPNTKIYEVHPAMTQEWAGQLIGLGYPADFPLSFDRVSGNADYNLGQLAAQTPGTSYKTFHFVLNNYVKDDNRIPPYGMSYEEARKRNALPVPDGLYGGTPGGTYNYFDEITLSPPAGAEYATIDLLYQPTSWEYIQFLWKANTGSNAFLANEGIYLLDAWLKTGMAAPFVMASTTWGAAPTPAVPDMATMSLTTWSVDKRGNFVAQSSTFKSGDTVGIEATVEDENQTPLPGVQVFMQVGGGTTVVDLQGFTDATGVARLEWKTPRRQAAGDYTAAVIDLIKSGYTYNPALGIESVVFTIQ